MQTIIDRLVEHADARPHGPAFRVLGDTDERRASWRERLDASRRLAGAVARCRRDNGDPVVLLRAPVGLEFVIGLLACMHARAPVVPMPPACDPDAIGVPPLQVAPRRPPIVLTTRAQLESCLDARCGACQPETQPPLPTLVVGEDEAQARMPPPEPYDVALLSWTPGPAARAVESTFSSLTHAMHGLGAALRTDRESVLCGWQPLHRGLGLFLTVLHALWSGGRTVLVPPSTAMRSPAKLVRLLSEERVTHTWAPALAYPLWISEPLDGDIDLSPLRVALIGHDERLGATLRRLAERLGPLGFRHHAAVPVYGRVECGGLVAARPVDESRASVLLKRSSLERDGRVELREAPGCDTIELVSVGAPPSGTHVAIIDPRSGEPCADGDAGEIWVDGPSNGSGYFRDPAGTRDVFGARVDGRGSFVRTGDRGFRLGRNLYVLGRLRAGGPGGNAQPSEGAAAGCRAHGFG